MSETSDLKNLISEILNGSRDMVLATCLKSIPWSAVLVFGHDQNFNLYWVSDENARHSQEILKNPNVAATVTIEPSEGHDKGLQIQGKAFVLPEEEILSAAREYFAKRGTDHMPTTVEEVNKLIERRSWYVLKPEKIYVIYEPLFGFDRKEYTPT